MNTVSTSAYPVLERLELEHFTQGQLARVHLSMGQDALGQPQRLPCLVARGPAGSPTVGITAAIHGDELNGIRVVQGLFEFLGKYLPELGANIVGFPLLNLPGVMRRQRYYSDNKDLNRLMPGKANGHESEAYAHLLVDKVLQPLDYLFDLHTASFGRINSHYVRANLARPQVAEMARLQNAAIVLNEANTTSGTLRGAAQALNIPAITVELGDPLCFQTKMIDAGTAGIVHWLVQQGFLPQGAASQKLDELGAETVHCSRSYWLYADAGGFLEVQPELTARLQPGQEVALLRNPFGDVLRTYAAPEAGIVIGKSAMPVGETGARILHLGIIQD